MIAQQTAFPELQKLLYSTRRAIGAAGEITIAKALESVGWSVDNPHTAKKGDLLCYSKTGREVRIEVKTARRNVRGEYCFTLIKSDKYGSADHRSTDFTIFLCLTKSGIPVPFVIPTCEIRDQRSLTITSHPLDYAGKYARFRQNIRNLRLK